MTLSADYKWRGISGWGCLLNIDTKLAVGAIFYIPGSSAARTVIVKQSTDHGFYSLFTIIMVSFSAMDPGVKGISHIISLFMAPGMTTFLFRISPW